MKKDIIYLIGFMGSGKTTIGKAFSVLQGYTFIDLDEFIKAKHGMEIPQIFKTFGEQVFREWETTALKECSKMEKVLIATGGGIIENQRNFDVMNRNGVIIYLKADFDTIYERIKHDSNRPITQEGLEGLKKRFNLRLPKYEQAKFTIDTETKSIQQTVRELQEKMDV
ncbi:shikimate kinase [Evansella sp. AB-rgal1]|uniref:shikimate kinase n=1 Tax=Evansella sp. AB-rgal1 TaxID=3242696 RepID=UPI00359DF0C0